eukprot:12570343-Alexandrium_andersonii.AAC.1
MHRIAKAINVHIDMFVVSRFICSANVCVQNRNIFTRRLRMLLLLSPAKTLNRCLLEFGFASVVGLANARWGYVFGPLR